MSEIKVFPIGYIASTNNTSMGAWTSGGTEENLLFEPNKGCNKTKVGFSGMSTMENRAIWTRKIGEPRHTFVYTYDKIWNHEFRRIRKFNKDVAQFKVNSFYIVDFSGGQQISALATGATWNASIYDTTDFSATSGEGGNYCCIWHPNTHKFRIGIINSKNDDSSITFSNTSDFGDLQSFTYGETWAYPMYRVFMQEDKEEFKVDAIVDPHMNASFAGPVRSGTVKFVQRDVR